jgi:stage II sporulation protein D
MWRFSAGGVQVLNRAFLSGFVFFLIILSTACSGALANEKIELLTVRLASVNEKITLQVTTGTKLSYLSVNGEWNPIPNVFMIPEQVWQVERIDNKSKLLLTTEAGDRVESTRPLRLTPQDEPYPIRILGREYAGEIELIPGLKGIEVFNRIDMERYVLGVLAGESINGWHLEALKAQAVAIRTYAASQMGRHEGYDYCDETHCQRYIGHVDHGSFVEAVAATRGQKLTFQGKVISAFYHSSSGGQTENNDDVWSGEPLPYLCSVEDYDHASDKYNWQVPYLMSVGDFLERLGFSGWGGCEISPIMSERTGNIVAYDFTRIGDSTSERLTRENIRWKLGLPSPRFEIRQIGGDEVRKALNNLEGVTVRVSNGQLEGDNIHLTLQLEVELLGQAINMPLRLESTQVLYITGRGYGHGVGLSQWGSQGMALKGHGYIEILHHYYGEQVELTI